MSVLRGGMEAISAGRVPVILLEYGDKMSPAIWDGMKRHFSDAAAAPTPQLMEGSSLYSLQTWASGIGYDTYLIGATGKRAILVPVTGRLWRDEYEVCRDKKQKFSTNGRTWMNFSAWNPQWSAVCWYDVALVLRKPRVAELRRHLLEATSLPPHFCDSVSKGSYPQWIDRPQPKEADLCCTHKVGDPRNGNGAPPTVGVVPMPRLAALRACHHRACDSPQDRTLAASLVSPRHT